MDESILAYLGVGRVEGLIADFQRLVDTVTEGTERTRKEFERTAGTIEKRSREVRKSIEKEVDEIQREWDRVHDRIERNHLRAFGRMDRAFAGFKRGFSVGLVGMRREWTRFWDDADAIMGRHLKTAEGSLGKVGGALGLSGGRGLASGIGVQIRQLTSVLGPWGGMAGLVIYGKQKQEVWRARAQTVMREFEAIGGSAHEMTRSVYGDIQTLERMWKSHGQELAATTGALAELGFAYEEATEEVDTETAQLTQNVIGLTTELDVMGKAAAGTSAKIAAQVAATTGDALNETADALAKIGIQAKNTGQSYTFLVNTLGQATMQLRLQRQGLEDVAPLYQRLQEGTARVFGGNRAFAAQRGAKQLEAVAGGLASDRLGFHSLLFQRMGGIGRDMDPLAFETALAEGNIGGLEGGDLLNTYVDLVQQFLEQQTPGRSRGHRIGFLMRAAGMGREEATGLVDIAGRDAGGGRPLSRREAEALRRGLSGRTAEMSKYERLMWKLQQDLARIGMSILKVLSGMATTLLSLAAYASFDRARGNELALGGERLTHQGLGEVIGTLGRMSEYTGETLFGSAALKTVQGLLNPSDPSRGRRAKTDEAHDIGKRAAERMAARMTWRALPGGERGEAIREKMLNAATTAGLRAAQGEANFGRVSYMEKNPHRFSEEQLAEERRRVAALAAEKSLREGVVFEGQRYFLTGGKHLSVNMRIVEQANPRGSPRGGGG